MATLFDRVLSMLISDEFFDEMQDYQDDEIVMRMQIIRDYAFKDAIKECGILIDRFHDQQLLYEVDTPRWHDYKCRVEGVLRVQDSLLELVGEDFGD